MIKTKKNKGKKRYKIIHRDVIKKLATKNSRWFQSCYSFNGKKASRKGDKKSNYQKGDFKPKRKFKNSTSIGNAIFETIDEEKSDRETYDTKNHGLRNN